MKHLNVYKQYLVEINYFSQKLSKIMLFLQAETNIITNENVPGYLTFLYLHNRCNNVTN